MFKADDRIDGTNHGVGTTGQNIWLDDVDRALNLSEPSSGGMSTHQECL